jgi:hypothetical protein
MGKCFSKMGEDCGTYDGGGEDVCENLGKVDGVNCVWYNESEKCYESECSSFDNSEVCNTAGNELVDGGCFWNEGCLTRKEFCSEFDESKSNCEATNSSKEGKCVYKNEKCYEESKVPKEKGSNTGFPLWVIMLIILLVLLVVGGIIVFMVIRKRRQRRENENIMADPKHVQVCMCVYEG